MNLTGRQGYGDAYHSGDGPGAGASDEVREAALRIGLFSESFHPVQNGVTVSLSTLVRELRAHGSRVWVFAPAHQGPPEREVNVLRFPSFVSAFNRGYPLAYPFLPRLALTMHFSKLRLDIVHTHTPFVLGLTGANLSISHSIPLVSTFHTLYSRYSHYMPLLPDTVTQNLIEHYLPWYYNRCSEVICPSDVAASALRALGVEQPIAIIPTAVPVPSRDLTSHEACRKLRSTIGIGPQSPVLMYAGRLAAEKNLVSLLEVYARVRREVPHAILLIAGDGPIKAELEATAGDMGLADGVRWVGNVPRRKMDTYYACADVFCFPSPTETQGLVVSEARAAGTPCVVVDAGGAPELVSHGEDGFRVPAGDVEVFASHVSQILTNRDLRERMRTLAVKNAMRYTPASMVERVLQVYDSARSRKSRPPWTGPPEIAEEVDWEAIRKSVREHAQYSAIPGEGE